jgi:hypothetical protein
MVDQGSAPAAVARLRAGILHTIPAPIPDTHRWWPCRHGMSWRSWLPAAKEAHDSHSGFGFGSTLTVLLGKGQGGSAAKQPSSACANTAGSSAANTSPFLSWRVPPKESNVAQLAWTKTYFDDAFRDLFIVYLS